MQKQDMASSSRLTSRTRSNLLDDLDLQPVREVRGRVLNDVPLDDDSSPPSSPKVKFSFVDVALPKLPKGGAEDYERSSERTARPRAQKDMEPRKERQRRAADLQRNMEDGRRQFVTQLLNRGVPVWEEVSEEERNSRFIGGTNPFRYQHRSKSRDASNITVRSNQKSSKVPSAVWEDVSKLPNIAQGIPSEDGFYSDGSSHNNTNRKRNNIPDNNVLESRENYQSDHDEGQQQHNVPLQQPPSEPRQISQTSSPGRPSEHSPTQCSNTHDYSPVQDSAREPPNHHLIMDDESSHAEGREDVPERSASGMKRKFGGKIEERVGSVITTRSWRIGERLARERYGPLPQVPQEDDQKEKGEEEKHERESTRESRNKRDLSASSRDETQPPRSRQKFASRKDESEREPAPPKTPPRVRSYKPEEIQKYMESKRSERLKSLKELKTQRQLEKVKKEERLKELALKTKELAQTGKKQSVPDFEKNQDAISKGDAHIENSQWGCPSDCYHDTVQNPSLNPGVRHVDEPVQVTTKPKDEISAKKGRIEKPSEPSGERREDVKNVRSKKTKKEGKKRRKKRTVSLSDSDSISDIVSRTLEECERQVRSSSISLESISSSSCVSLSSSDSEMKSSESQSSASSFDIRPKPRVLSLGQMAQKLTSRIEREEENLRSNAGQKREGEPDSMPSHQSKVSKAGVKDVTPKENLSYSQIQTLSVDELIARMTAMLPQNASRLQGRVDQVPPKTSNTKHNDPKGRNAQSSLTPQMIHQRLRQEQQNQRQTPSSRIIAAAEKEDIPDLLPPDIPTLQLSGGNIARPHTGTSVPQPKVNTLLSLPGNNIPLLKGQVVPEISNDSSLFQFTGYNPQNIPGASEPHSHGRKNMMEKAALRIQSVYRGYCVRKVTSAILGKKFGRSLKKKEKVPQTIIIGHGARHPTHNKFFKKQNLNTDHPNRGEMSSSDDANEVDWRKIRLELENKSQLPKRDAPYVFKKTDLPEWIKPYIVLSETGNIDNFIDSRGREQETVGQVVAEGEHTNHPQKTAVNNDSDKENIEGLDNTELDATLTEGLISDIDKTEINNMQEKETQTDIDVMKYEKKRKEKSKDQKNQKLIKEKDKNTFVDLKKTFTGEKTLLLGTADASVNNTEINSGAVAMKPKASPTVVKYAYPETSKALKSRLNRSEKHETTIEEGPLEEELQEGATVHAEPRVSSSESERPYPSDLEEGEIMGSSGVQETPASSVGDDGVRAPHQLLGRGPHFAPASLRLRLNAELMYQDTLGEALSQLRDAEQFQILSKNSQEAIAYSQSLALQHQERLEEEQRRKEEEQKKEEEKKRQEQDKRRKEEEERKIREDQKRHQEALLSVERMEKEAKDRLAQLEKEVRARAEQILSSTTQMAPPQPTGSQPDVIAAAAVAAVGATISQWERLRPVRAGASSGLESSAVILSQGSSMRDSHHYSSTFTGSSGDRSRSRVSRSEKYSSSNRSASSKSHKSSSVSERISVVSADRSKSSVAEDLPSSIHSASTKYSVEEQVLSTAESSRRSSMSEEISTEKDIPTVNHRKKTQSESSVQEEEGLTSDATSQDKSVVEEVESDAQSNILTSKSVSEALISTGLSKKDETVQSSYADKQHITEETPGSGSGSQELIEDIAGTSTNVSSGPISSTMRESLPSKSGTSLSEVYSKEPSKSESSQVQESIRTSTHSAESVSTSKTIHTSTATSKSRTESSQNESKEKSDAYSESFEVESGSDGSSSSSSAIPSQSKKVRDYNGDLSIVVTSANILTAMDQMDYTAGGGLPSGMFTGGSSSALGMTLNMMESMQKEEELRHQHQKALLKLQEQSLIEEARWKLAALQSEGGPGLRKKQRAVLLQLREQRAHLRRLIETQNLAAQQRRLLLLQHYHLLATTNGAAAIGARGYVTTSRGQSPNPTSPRLTPRMMDVNISSSSESQDDISLHLSLKGKDAGSSSPSDGGGREKRRSHSEERKRMSSMRLQEKRRATEVDLLHQQLLQEEKEIFRLKNQEKEPSKVKRKGEIGSRRPRDKREKSPSSPSSLAALVQDNVSSTGSSVPEESVDASAHDSQSSMPEEGGMESVGHSDAASSVSEHEEVSSRSKLSIPLELAGTKKLPLSEETASARVSGSARSSSAQTVASEVQTSHVSEDIDNVSASKYSKSAESKSTPQTSSVDTKTSRSSDKTSSIRTIVSDSNSKSTDRPDGSEKNSKSAEGQSTTKTSSIVSEVHTRSRTDTAVSEEVSREAKSQAASVSSRSGSESNHVSEAKSKVSSAKALPLPIRVPLSPRSPHRHHRRYSSESDDSFTLSQTETASDISDGEGKLLALKEQLASRRAEADRLRKEKRRLRRERLASQEHALRQQISAYDSYIHQARMELEKESKELQQASMVRPLIKKPQVAETKKSRQSESILTSPDKSDISETSILSEGTKSEQSEKSSSKSKEEISKASSSMSPREFESQEKSQTKSLLPESIHTPVQSELVEKEAEKPPVVLEPKAQDQQCAPEDAETSRVSQASSISEDYSFEEETTTSEHSNEHTSPSPHKSLSHDSSQDTDHTPSQASSTETIVHSPKKQDSGPKDDEEDSILDEISGLASQNEQDKSKDESKVIDLNEIVDVKQEEEKQVDVESPQQESKLEKKEPVDSQVPNVLAETEKKLEIFIPTPDLGSQEGYDSSEQDKDTSLEGSIGEEIVDEQYEESGGETSDHFVDSGKDVFTIQDADQKKEDEVHSGSRSLDTASSKDASSEKAKEDLSKVSQKIDSGEDVQPLEDGQAHSLRTQRLVDDISNNLLASMMKETSQLFTSILKERNTGASTSDDKFSKEEPSVSFTGEGSLPKAEDSKKEVQPSLLGGENKKLESPASQHEDPPTSSVSSSKSQILKRVSDLIAEGNTSPRSPSVISPRQNELVLTPQLTFDLSPDVLSPVSSTPASPTKVSVGLDNRLPEKSASFVDKTSEQEHEEAVSPTHSASKGHHESLDMAALTNKLLNIAATPDLDLDDKLGQLDGDDTEFSVEGIEGNWFDDDFWTSADNRKKQQQLKAEEERIAAEIARLEELQRLQEQYPGLVIREVPNKPPPPYTPPTSTTPSSASSVSPSTSPTMPPAYSVATPRGDEVPLKSPSPVNTISVPHRLSKADLRKLATEIFHVVPSRKEEVMTLVKDALDCLHEAWERGLEPSLVEPPESFITTSPSVSQNEDSSEEEEEGSARIFRRLLFCLMREIVSEAYQHQNTPVPPPWIKQPFPPTKILLAVRTSSKPALYSHAEEQVKVLFGWSPSSKKESLMMRWARKHRDLVDQVLVRELQAEESSWTQYDEDEASVKVQVASEILDDLISDTVTVFMEIIARKMTLIV
ncbi:serine-rich adhesin for platelets-like isoform X2 [Penaeus japonicus]|uniref:serine-rich adhesin for platelets-like isoform X2 n=1 Tax=Penaeus japonicus TaxID=27405 RepID=UPI001C713727|nr:serine-rich adhesin for platelets-like isoform X2 [Penaeus japonicus]